MKIYCITHKPLSTIQKLKLTPFGVGTSNFPNDFVVETNGENIANGYGITPKLCDDLFSLGINVISSGNHIWDQKEIIPYIAKNNNLLKPHNLVNDSAGYGHGIFLTESNDKILVINLMCNLFMRKSTSGPLLLREAPDQHDKKAQYLIPLKSS